MKNISFLILLLPRRWEQYTPPKCLYIPAKARDVILLNFINHF